MPQSDNEVNYPPQDNHNIYCDCDMCDVIDDDWVQHEVHCVCLECEDQYSSENEESGANTPIDESLDDELTNGVSTPEDSYILSD